MTRLRWIKARTKSQEPGELLQNNPMNSRDFPVNVTESMCYADCTPKAHPHLCAHGLGFLEFENLLSGLCLQQFERILYTANDNQPAFEEYLLGPASLA